MVASVARLPAVILGIASGKIDKDAKRLLRQRWPGLVELGRLPFVAYSTYLECGLGLEGRNCDILTAIGLHIKGHGRHFVIGGDFNLTPQEMRESIWPESFGGVVVTGHTMYTTASAGKTGRHID